MGYRIGIDTGGTFTDVMVIDDSGKVTAGKSPTTPDNLDSGIMSGVGHAAAQLGLTLGELVATTSVLRVSGTTATNALLTRAGDRIGMITTRGFEDTIAIGRAIAAWTGIPEVDLRRVHRHRKPAPLLARELIRGISERTDVDGVEVAPVDVSEVQQMADELVGAGVSAIAVCLLWSIRNPAHELKVREVIAAHHPQLPVHCSHSVAPAIGEYERFMTTAADAYVSRVLTTFLSGFERELVDHGFSGQLLIAQADGGCLFPEDARPVYTLQSGPAGGVIASHQEGGRLGIANIVTTDVGGTSFDVGLIAERQWTYAREPELGGLSLSVPMIEIASIGAGGGSIAWVDDLGVLHVGPQSAGSVPGPACYGRGGVEPTVTDADLLLGYLDPESFLGGRMALDRDAAHEAMERVADRVGLSPIETAAGIFAIANAHMGDLLARQVVSRGYDPRDFIILAYGGAGPMHSAFYGADARACEVIVPAHAGTFSAFGVASAPLLHSARAHTFASMPVAPDLLNSKLAELDRQVSAALDKDGVPPELRDVRYNLELRYGMQVHTVRLSIERGQHDAESINAMAERFDVTYEQLYGAGSGFPDAGRFLTGIVVEGVGQLNETVLDGAALDGSGSLKPAVDSRVGVRDALFEGRFVPTDIHRYDLLTPGSVITAPAIIEAAETTIVVPPGCVVTIDEWRNVRLTGLDKIASTTGGAQLAVAQEV